MLRNSALSKAHKSAILKLLLANLIWGAAGPVIKYTLDYVPVFTFLFLRFLIASVIMLPFLIIEEKKNPPSKRDFLLLVLFSLLGGAITLAFTFYGYKYTTSLDGSLLSALLPVLIIVASFKFLNEKISKNEKIGTVVAISGSLIVLLEPVLSGQAASEVGIERIIGNILVIISLLTWTVYTILSKKFLDHAPSKLGKILHLFHLSSTTRNYSPFYITGLMSMVALIAFAPLSFIELSFMHKLAIPTLDSTIVPPLLGILFMAVLSTVVAYTLYASAIKTIEVSQTAIYDYLIPVFTIPFAYLLLGEVVDIWYMASAVVIGIGIYISQKNPNH